MISSVFGSVPWCFHFFSPKFPLCIDHYCFIFFILLTLTYLSLVINFPMFVRNSMKVMAFDSGPKKWKDFTVLCNNKHDSEWWIHSLNMSLANTLFKYVWSIKNADTLLSGKDRSKKDCERHKRMSYLGMDVSYNINHWNVTLR